MTITDKVVEAILKEERSLRAQAYDLQRQALSLANLANQVQAGDVTGKALEELAATYNVVQQTKQTKTVRGAKKQTEEVQKE